MFRELGLRLDLMASRVAKMGGFSQISIQMGLTLPNGSTQLLQAQCSSTVGGAGLQSL